MGDEEPPPDKAMGASLDGPSDMDFMEELLSGKDWLEIPACTSFLNQDGSLSPFGLFDPAKSSPGVVNDDINCILAEVSEKENQCDVERWDFPSASSIQIQEEEGIVGEDACRENNYLAENAVLTSRNDASNSKSLLIEPVADSNTFPSIKERLTYALMYIKESLKEGGVLVQIWVPVEKEGQYVLTTCAQPFWLDHHCQRLVNYRTVSTNYQFSAQRNSKEVLGLPGRVFVGKVPEWTPDVRFFRSHEYPRVNYAQQCDVRGSLAVPVFERGSHSCLGVLEIVMIKEKVTYDLDLENICNALQAVDLRSSITTGMSNVQVRNDLYETALPEILEVLSVVCQKHNLPLAQTWVPCIQQGKRGTRHSDENYQHCVSTVDAACYVNDSSVLGFHKACFDYHLLVGQGLVGHAFTTNQPCFSSDISALSKTRYPLSHHARIFGLRGAVAIRLRSIHTGTADFVLEFFLPVDFIDYEIQRMMLNSLSTTIQDVCQTLRVVTEKELMDGNAFVMGDTILKEGLPEIELVDEGQRSYSGVGVAGPDSRPTFDDPRSSMVTSKVIEVQNKGKDMLVSSEQLNFEECNMSDSGFVQWNDPEMSVEYLLSDFANNQEILGDTINFNVTSVNCEAGPETKKRISKKRRGKAEKVISMQVLQEHFAGSLKDAAKSLGVCPTTLKRICRVHGINRWPSRKIKKVGNSLQKIQQVIDAVEGVGGASQLNALYSKLSKVPGSDFVTQAAIDNPGLPNVTPNDEEPADGEDGFPNTPSAESSHASSTSSHNCNSNQNSNGPKQQLTTTNTLVEDDYRSSKDRNATIKRAPISIESHRLADGDLQCNRAIFIRDWFPAEQSDYAEKLLRVKAVCGEDMVRLKLQPSWGLPDLKVEIAKRFKIENVNSVVLKYLDDDSEWVLLTCDADLHECVDIHKNSSHTIKISVRCLEPSST